MDTELLAGALAAISRKDRTEREIRAWLVDHGADQAEVEAITGHLIEHLAIDDVRFAVEYTRDKRELSGWGNERIRGALLDRGIRREIVEEALCEDAEAEVERALEMLEEKGVQVRDAREKQRALGMLARRGYSSEDSYSAIRLLERQRAA